MAAGAVSQRKSHDIVILSFCNIVKGQAKWKYECKLQYIAQKMQQNVSLGWKWKIVGT